jgi:hypothetical protein
MDDLRFVALEPPLMILGAFEALVSYIGSQRSMTHARQPSVWPVPHGEECFGHLLIGGGSGTEAKASYDSHRGDGHKQTEAFVPSQAIAPSNVGAAS